MHQGRMKDQNRGVVMFNNLDRAENLVFHSSSYDPFVFDVCVSYYLAFVTYVSFKVT